MGPPVNIAWHLRENYRAKDSCSLSAWGFFMNLAAETWNEERQPAS
jgi:hypothetical protein